MNVFKVQIMTSRACDTRCLQGTQDNDNVTKSYTSAHVKKYISVFGKLVANGPAQSTNFKKNNKEKLFETC